MKKKLLLGLMVLCSGVALASLTGKFLRVCHEGVCLLKKSAEVAYQDFSKNAEQFLKNTLVEVTKPLGIDLPTLANRTEKIKKDVGTLKADIDKLKQQVGQQGTTYNTAKNMTEALDRFDDAVIGLKKANPPYTKTEITTAITGVPGAIEWLWGGRSKQVQAHFKAMLAEYAVIRDGVPNLDLQELGVRAQKVIGEIVTILDNITDIRVATGSVGNAFISDVLTTNFRALRDDLLKVTARIGTIVAYRSFVVGGPLSNTALAQKVGVGIIGNIFDLGGAYQGVQDIKKSIDTIKIMADTLKQEGPIAEAAGKRIEAAAQIKPMIERIKKVVSQATIGNINRSALQEVQRSIKDLRIAIRELITLSLTMVEQVANILDRAHTIGVNIDKLLGGGFVQPAVLRDLGELSKDLNSIRRHVANIHAELRKTADSF